MASARSVVLRAVAGGLLAWICSGAVTARELALTFDDLPWAHFREEDGAAIQEAHGRLLAALADAGLEAVGFVNPDQLDHPNIGPATGRRMLADWLSGGHVLGNHGWGHLDLHAVGTTAFKAGILAAEIELRPLLEAHGQGLQWFRHPYLRTGIDPAQRAEIESFLQERGYVIAPVSVDNSDWIYAQAYLRMRGDAVSEPELAAFRAAYVGYLLDKVNYYEQQAEALLGEALPHVLLLHANRLNADVMPELLEALRAAGWRAVPLQQALSHAAYQRPDRYAGRFGPSWIHRWALTEGKRRDFFGEEPRVPADVLARAGVDSE